jgi:hypothetical protein
MTLNLRCSCFGLPSTGIPDMWYYAQPYYYSNYFIEMTTIHGVNNAVYDEMIFMKKISKTDG